MMEYKGAAIFKSVLRKKWYAVFGWGDYIVAKTRKAAQAAVDERGPVWAP